MRKWHKYCLDPVNKGKIYLPIDKDFEDHEKAMGGYNVDEVYRSKSDFFNKYFFGYHFNRLEMYDNFLRKHLKKEDTVLSVASGRCANELYLMEDSYMIVCSDLKVTDVTLETRKLFPNFKFVELDILNTDDTYIHTYNTVMCLSLIWLFDQKDLERFLQNVHKILKSGGRLILDFAGSPDNILSHLINEIWLKYETILRWIVKSIIGKTRYGFVIKHHGYRRTDNEIIECAKQCGFELIDKQNYAFLTEFRRSHIFNKLVKPDSLIEKVFGIIGRNIPYIRMGLFQKIA